MLNKFIFRFIPLISLFMWLISCSRAQEVNSNNLLDTQWNLTESNGEINLLILNIMY